MDFSLNEHHLQQKECSISSAQLIYDQIELLKES